MQGGQSYWLESTGDPGYPELDGDLEASVAVVGGGIVGLTTALLLARDGVDAVLLEAAALGAGVSGHTTGKVTAGHGLAYSRLQRDWGAETARLYAGSQSAGVELVRKLAAEHEIECDLEEVANFVFAEREVEVPRIEAEAEAAASVGLRAGVVRRPDVPFPALAAVRLEGQAQFHPRKYLLGLGRAAHGSGARIFESTRVTSLDSERPRLRLRTERGTVVARHVVLATHVPITHRGLYFARVHPRRSYAVAAPFEHAPFEGMWINVGSPTRSLRTTPRDDGGRLLVVVGEGHRVGQDPRTTERYDRLEAYLHGSFPGAAVHARWSTQDAYSVDGLPYVGRVGSAQSSLHVATGFGGWGLSGGTLAARLLVDGIVGRSNPWSSLYAAGRAAPSRSAARFLRENAKVAAELVRGRLAARPSAIDGIASGEGRVVALPGGKAAVTRDDEGRLHVVSAVCTHMGCIVAWNPAERTWDCPCHGSRFDPDGRVLEGPATAPLEPREPSSGARAPSST